MRTKQNPRPSFQEKLRIFQRLCRENGIKLTPQRLQIFREIAMDKSHPSAEDVYMRLERRMPTISRDTVYRTLATFERLGVIAKLQALDHRGRYDPNVAPHCHLVCTKCKTIQDFYWASFDKTEVPPETKKWGVVDSKYLELRGICKKCLKKNPRWID